MPFESDIEAGMDCYLYRNTGTHVTPVWVLMAAAKDVEVTFSKSKLEAKDRNSKFNFKRGSFVDIGLNFSMDKYSVSVADYVVLLDSALNNTPIEFFAADGPVATPGSEGWRGVFEVFEIPEKQELEGLVMFDVSCDITRVTESSALVEPDYYTVPTP